MNLEDLHWLYYRATNASHGKPDEYQLHQNNLTKGIAEFLLKEYWIEQEKKENKS